MGNAFLWSIRPRPWITSRLDAPQTPFWGGYNPIFSIFQPFETRSRVKNDLLRPAPGVIPDGLCISKTNSTTGLKNYQRSYQLAMLALPAIFICSLTYCKGNRLRFLIKFSVNIVLITLLWQCNIILTKKLRDGPLSLLQIHQYFDNPTLYWQKFWEMVPSRFSVKVSISSRRSACRY
jgi:hypothetical protein